MINRGKQMPFGAPFRDRIIVERFVSRSLTSEVADLHACANGEKREFVDRGTSIQQANVRFFDQSQPSNMAFLDLDKSRHRDYSITSNDPSADSLTVNPSPGVLSERSMLPFTAFGSPLKMYQ